jgi:polysaccharide biosynthesis/export protein
MMRYTRALISIALLSAACCHAQIVGTAPANFDQPKPIVDTAQLDALLAAKRPPLLFVPGDVLSLKIYGLKDYDADSEQVAEDGTVLFPLVGRLGVAGLTVPQVSDLITSHLVQSGIIMDPQISVAAVKRPKAVVTVSGFVSKPGVLPVDGDRTILDYLSEAGAFSQLGQNPAEPNPSTVVTLVRAGLPAPVNIPLGVDPQKSPYGRIPAFPGDQIMVAKLGMIYAVGAFRLQGVYPLKAESPTTLMQLVALAGGIGYEADLNDAHVVRTLGTSRFLLPVNVGRILDGKAADIPLMSDDILFVPTNKLKAAIKGGGSGLIVSIASALIYTH